MTSPDRPSASPSGSPSAAPDPAAPAAGAFRLRLRRAVAWGAVLAGLAVLVLAVWSRRAADAPPPRPVERGERPVVLITVDTTRADRIGAYRPEGERDGVSTPHLDRLAEQGVLFENAYSVAPITLVAHTSILTGLEPPVHGVRNNGLHYVPDRVETLAERLREEGYATGAFVAAAVLDRRYNLDQGFDVYDDDLSAGRERHPRMVADRPAEAVVRSAAQWLDGLPPEEPFFLWVHLYDPHAAYSPPPPFRDDFRESLYDGEIAYMDSWIGRLLRHPRLAGDALVTVLGDHGESLGEHGEQTHALLAYDATLHVPWILRLPGGPQGLRLPQTVGQVDLVPTVLDLLGLDPLEHDLPEGGPPADGAAGVSLLPLLEGRPERIQGTLARRPLYAETFLPYYTYGWAKLRVLRQGRMKWIDAPEPELYDTVRDPRELSNLASQEPGLSHDLGRSLDEHLERLGDGDHAGESALELDSEARERLRSLGYLAVGSGRPPGDDGDRPDPKAMIDLHVGLERARSLARDRLFSQAERQLREVLRRDRTNLAAMIDLATVLSDMGELDEAAEVTEQALALDPAYPRLHLLLAGIEAQRGDAAQALELVEGAIALDPRSLEARLRQAQLLHRLGRRDEAVAVLRRSVEEGLDAPPLQVLLARLGDLPGDPAAAEERVRTALERDPFLVGAWHLLGEVLEGTGRPEEALEAWRAGLERQPDDPELHARLGLSLARRRAGAEAEVHLREAIRLATAPRPDLHVTLGAWLAEQGRWEAAQREYERVLETDPDHPAARNNRAVAYYQTGRPEEAEREWRELVRRHPAHADAHNNLAALALRAERWDEARERARRALALQPRMAEAWSNLGLAFQGLGEGEEARRRFERALELDPGYWQARLNLGVLLADQGRSEEAAAVLEALLARVPGLPTAHLELGLLHAGPLADPERARSHLNAFLRRAPDHPRADEVRRRLRDLPAG